MLRTLRLRLRACRNPMLHLLAARRALPTADRAVARVRLTTGARR